MQANLTVISTIAAIDYTAIRASVARFDQVAGDVVATLRRVDAPPILASVIEHAAKQLCEAVLNGTITHQHSKRLECVLEVGIAWLETR